MIRIPIALALGGLFALSSTTVLAQSVTKHTPDDIVATVGSATITLAQVDELALKMRADQFGNLRLSHAMYEARRVALDELVANVLFDNEAKAQHLDRTTLLEREVASKVKPPTESDVAAWYQANQESVQGVTIDEAREPIRSLLLQEQAQSAQQAYIDRLKAKTSIKRTLEPTRETVSADGAALGPADAPIEMVEFADFECPYCLRAFPIVKQVIAAYGNRMRLVYRNYPLPQHPNARPAAEAAQCAHDQGKFWPYHDRLFGDPTKLGEADLKQAAAEIGLDTGRFNTCFDSHSYRSQIEADIQAGGAAGVTGTPSFFINGRPLVGAPPFEDFTRIIDEELEAKSRR
jgi:protein-disulfide isomerase